MASDHNLGAWQRIALILALEVSSQWKCVLIAIAQHEAMKDGICRASVTTLAKRASVSRRWLGINLEPMEAAGLIAIDQRRNGAAPVIEICWDAMQGITRAQDAQVKSKREATCALGAQVVLTEPSLNRRASVTCANDASDVRNPDTQPAQIQHEPAHAVRTSAFSVEAIEEECGSRQALTPLTINGSTLTTDEIAARKKFCAEVRPPWAKDVSIPACTEKARR